MGRHIEPQAKQIILKVIQFCEEEKQKGLLAPRQQAIRRACLATGLSEYTILKIRNEAQNATVDGHVDEYVSHGDDEILRTDIHQDSGPSTGLDPASTSIETILVKVEPMQEDSSQAEISYEVNCEYEFDPEREVPLNKRYLEDECKGSPHSTDEVAADLGDVKCEYKSDQEYDDDLGKIALEQRRLKTEPAQEDIRRGGAAQRAKPKKRKQAAETTSVQQAHQSRGDATAAPGDRRHQCTVCHKCFSRSSDLKRHFRLHTGELPHECIICQRQFGRKNHLHEHLRIHTGEKPFECNICQRRYNHKGTLLRHLRTHTGEKPFECNICQRRFSSNYILQVHLKTHTGDKPFECNICQRRFSRKIHLRQHLRTHTGEKPFECNICQRRFSQKINLQVHLKTHTGEKPFGCIICQRRYGDKRSLQKHLRNHNGEKPF